MIRRMKSKRLVIFFFSLASMLRVINRFPAVDVAYHTKGRSVMILSNASFTTRSGGLSFHSHQADSLTRRPATGRNTRQSTIR